MLHPGVTLGGDVVAEVASELNVKVIDDVDTLSGLMSWTVVPNFRALGPRLGPRVNEVKAALAAADGSALQSRLEADGFIEVAGERLAADDVEVRATRHEAFALAEESGWAVALDLELDDDLRREGLARELVRSLNDLRKEIGLAVSDRVAVAVAADGPVADAVAHHRDYVAAEVLAVELTVEAPDSAPDGAHDLTVDGHPVRVTVTRSLKPCGHPAAERGGIRACAAARNWTDSAAAAEARVLAVGRLGLEHGPAPLAGAAAGVGGHGGGVRVGAGCRRGRGRAQGLVGGRPQLGRQPAAAGVARQGERHRLGRRAEVHRRGGGRLLQRGHVGELARLGVLPVAVAVALVRRLGGRGQRGGRGRRRPVTAAAAA